MNLTVRMDRNPLRIVLATQNPGKVTEIRALLADLPVELIPARTLDAPPSVVEDKPTLEGNAHKKAEAYYRYTGLPALADDTGLEVEALEGKPGVRSARFAGAEATYADNNELLLRELEGQSNRRAQFRTVVAFIDGDEVRYFEGVCKGHIAEAPRGTGGFGYDPLFVPEGESRTFAEMPSDEKNAISHRKRALHQFVVFLRKRLAKEEDA